ncbi:Rhs element Vgr family protein [Minicystis rosea]|nr:Rhs element Vgr family protein [Minicystis rosea]
MTIPHPLKVRIESSAFSSESFHVYRMLGKETISQLFSIEVEVASKTDTVDCAAAVGTDVGIVFERDGTELRRIHGMIAEAHDLLARSLEYRLYRIRVVPRALRLALVETSEVSMNVAVPDIIRNKLALVGLSDVELRLRAAPPTREFVVQYQETDLAFVSRLAEHLGIAYYFRHDGGQDTMVFTDHAGGFEPAGEPIRFSDQGQLREVYQLEAVSRVIPGVFVMRDYNYRQPLLDLTANHAVDGFGGVVEFGAHYKTPDEGKVLAQIRAEERQSTQLTYTGKSNVPAIGAGVQFTVEDHPYLGSVDLVGLSVEHRLNVSEDASLDLRAEAPQHYTNVFHAIPAQQPYRPPRVTPRPRVDGLVTGIVDAGPGGSSDYAQIDDQGRYLVRILFDTAAGGGTAPSRPVRMIQNHAGENYGTHFPLKPGVEVLLAFVNGDPDRPLIVGAVPNPLTPSPVDNANRTTHRIKTKAGILFDLVDE